ncbi:MAG TPA: TlpA disulfide reductase family protein [Gammaproteobacteria bacterium]|nr:TlpA disulfide reductase family protein [Gammaproteobacteria bacterium]
MRAALLAAVLLAAAAAGFFAWRHTVEPDTVPATGTLTPAAGTVRPQFSLPDVGGQMRSISDWDGRALVVNFWATWCAPCRREIPLLMTLQRSHDPARLQVIGVAIDDAAAVRQYAAELGINYPVLVGEQAALDAAAGFGVEFVGLPFTVFVDRDGNVRKVHLGELEKHEIDALAGEILGGSRPTG